MIPMLLATATAAAFAASPISGDASFVLQTLHHGASNVRMCIGKRYEKRPLVSFVYRLVGTSYVRAAIIRTRASIDGASCPQASADLAIPDLSVGESYVLALFALPEPSTPLSSDPSRVVTFGTPANLEPILYLGLRVEN